MPSTQSTRHVIRVRSLLGHAIVAIGIRIGRRRFEQIDDLRNRKAFRRAFGVEVSHDRHAELRVREFPATRGVSNHRHVSHKLFVVEELKQRFEFARLPVHDQQRKDPAVRVTITRRPAPRRIGALQHVHHAGESGIGRERNQSRSG